MIQSLLDFRFRFLRPIYCRLFIGFPVKSLVQFRQFIRCIRISVMKPASHTQNAVLEPVPAALFVDVVGPVGVTGSVAVLVAPSELITVTLVISTVLTIVTGPEEPSVTIVLREAEVIV